MSKMKMLPILLGIRRQKASETLLDKISPEWDEEEWEDLHDLRKPGKIVIADDTNAYQLFGDSIFPTSQEGLFFSESTQSSWFGLMILPLTKHAQAFTHCLDRAV
jgi:Protein of unknown function (DUF3684)